MNRKPFIKVVHRVFHLARTHFETSWVGPKPKKIIWSQVCSSVCFRALILDLAWREKRNKRLICWGLPSEQMSLLHMSRGTVCSSCSMEQLSFPVGHTVSCLSLGELATVYTQETSHIAGDLRVFGAQTIRAVLLWPKMSSDLENVVQFSSAMSTRDTLWK